MRGIVATLLGIALVGAAARSPAQPSASPPPPFRVIVHPSNRVAILSRDFLADVFLKKKTRWSGDRVIRPVDLDPRSTARRRFSSDVLRRPVEAVRSYWRQIIFSGRGVPPPELDSDQQVISYVLKHEDAIGYVSPAADLSGAGVRIVTVR